jgi:hypothetical protein
VLISEQGISSISARADDPLERARAVRLLAVIAPELTRLDDRLRAILRPIEGDPRS